MAFWFEVTETRPINFKLEVGGVTQTVEVNASTETLDTDTSALGETIQTQTMLQLPDLGRNVFDFAMLVPGVNNVGGASTPHIGGSRNANNEQLIDGMTNITPENNVGNNVATATPIEDSVQEINVQTSVLPAEYGRFSGGTESLVTKSGSNQWHGSYFEFIQQGALNAIPFGQPGVKNTGTKPDMHNYYSGGTVGGPIIHNRAFFFVDYQYTSSASGAFEADHIPNPALFNGDFTSLFGSTTPVLYDPDTVVKNSSGVYVRQPFMTNGQYNVIPANRISKVAQAALGFYPKPNIAGATGGSNNYQITQSVPGTDWRFDTREDMDVTKKWHSFLRFSMEGNHNTTLSDYSNAASNGGYGGADHYYVYSGSFNNTITFSPTLLAEFRYGYSRQTSNRVPVGGPFDPTTLGFDANYVTQASKQLEIFPHFNFGGANNGGFSDLGPLGLRGIAGRSHGPGRQRQPGQDCRRSFAEVRRRVPPAASQLLPVHLSRPARSIPTTAGPASIRRPTTARPATQSPLYCWACRSPATSPTIRPTSRPASTSRSMGRTTGRFHRS